MGGGGGKAALTQIPVPSARLQFPLGTIWHAVDGGRTQTVNASWKVK